MSYYLFIDDERVPSQVKWVELPHVSWVIARTYNEFVKCIETKGLPEFIAFDHDLSPEHYPQSVQKSKMPIDYTQYKEKTGYDCAKWLINYCTKNKIKLPKWKVHSLHDAGKTNIIQLLQKFAADQVHESI